MKRFSLLIIAFAVGYIVTLAGTDTRTIKEGQTIFYTYYTNLSNTTFCEVIDETIVECIGGREKYTIKGLKSGTTTIKFGTGSTGHVSYVDHLLLITVIGVNSISIDPSLILTYGEEYQFNPVIKDAGAETTLTWKSSDIAVATVDQNGKLKTTGLGTTTITCTATNGVSATCEVTVNPILVSDITLNETETELVVGDKLELLATVSPDNATDNSITWSSTNEEVAVVNENGQVTAVGSGICQIKATANDGSNKVGSCIVTVAKDNKLTVSNMALGRGGQGTMHVLLSNEELTYGFQFELSVPTGVSVPTDNEGKLMAYLTSRASSHNINATKVSNGLYRFVVTPKSGLTPIAQGSGDVMTITLDALASIAASEYYVTIQNIGLSVKRGNDYLEIHPRDNTAKLTVFDVTPGDVNGDGSVSVTDVISIISYVLEEEPSRFIFKAADVNNDNNVTVTDAIIVINMILNQ